MTTGRAFLALAAVLLLASLYAKESAPQHLAIVIDRSVQDRRSLERSARTAIQAVNRLTGKDTVSIVAYGDSAEVVLHATSATNRASVAAKVKGIRPHGMKALFAGMAMGAEELRRHSTTGQTMRVMVLAGTGKGTLIGPDTEEDIRTLVDSLRKENIGVSAPFGLLGSGAGSGGRPVFSIVRESGQKTEKPAEAGTAK